MAEIQQGVAMNAPLHKEFPAVLLNDAQALAQASAQWDGDIVERLKEYIQIPAKSPGFDASWAQHGYLQLQADCP